MIVVLDVDPMRFEQCYKKDLDGEDCEFVTNLIVSVRFSHSITLRSWNGQLTQLRGP